LNSKPISYSGSAQQLAQLDGRYMMLFLEMEPPSQEPIFSYISQT